MGFAMEFSPMRSVPRVFVQVTLDAMKVALHSRLLLIEQRVQFRVRFGALQDEVAALSRNPFDQSQRLRFVVVGIRHAGAPPAIEAKQGPRRHE
jgi:hypothetical protein